MNLSALVSIRFSEPGPRTRSAAHWFYALIVFCAMCFPGSMLGGVPLKTIAFLAIGILVLRAPGLIAPDLGKLVIGFAFPGVLIAWLILGLAGGYGKLSVLHFKDFVATYLTAYFALTLLRDDGERYRFLFLPALAGLGVAALVKLALGYLSFRSVPVETFVPAINDFLQFGVAFSSYDGKLPRLYLPSDVAICFALFFLGDRKMLVEERRIVAVALTILLTASCFLSISRFHWGGLALVAFVLLLRRQFLVGGAMIGAVLPLALWALSQKMESITARYTSESASMSDGERLGQVPALAEFFVSSPFWGHGLGSYTTDSIRSAALPYSYEIQWLSTAGQIGIVGMAMVLLLVWQPLRRCIESTSALSAKVAFFIIYGVWLFSGLTNPYLLSTFGGVVFAMFLAFAAPPEER